MKTLEKQIRAFAAKSQNISHGIFESALSLADGLADGSITEEEATEQLAELRSDLAEADAE
jgi:hypothetical protein